ncbi:hypothetical protein C8Q78DRAFT_947802, partial [Trametes maxima]
PFNNPAADTILCSSDGVHFRVHRIIVSEASPIFADMFTVPQPPRGSRPDDDIDFSGDTPIVHLQEDSQTLDGLLRLCYPVPDPSLRSHNDIRKIFAAAAKYEMEEAIAIAKGALHAFTLVSPLEGWAVACALRLEQEATSAAFAMCRVGAIPRTSPEALRHVTAGQYLRLLKFIRHDGDVDGESFSFWVADPSDAVEPSPSRVQLRPRPDKPLTLQERPFADLICRTSDGRELLTHKAILATVSTILQKRLLAIDVASHQSTSSDWRPNSATMSTRILPVLELDHPREDLTTILELCYPVKRITSRDLQLSIARTCRLARIAEQYEMQYVYRLLHSTFDEAQYYEPLKAFLFASSAELTEFARSAERTVLRRDPSVLAWIPELEENPASAFHELVM